MVLLIHFCSCTHKPVSGDLVSARNFNPSPKFGSTQDLDNQLRKLGSLDARKNQENLVKILIAFQQLKRALANNQIVLLPDSETHIKLLSFCASPEKAIPEPNEIFKWTKGLPSIPYIDPLLKIYANSSNSKKQNDMQDLLWNLANETYYEDYPSRLKDLLQEASPSAQLGLPSRAKNDLLKRIIPEEIANSVELLRGEYHSYNEFRASVEERTSKISSATEYMASRIPDTSVFTTNRTNGYESQNITFYKPTSGRAGNGYV